MKKFCRIVTLLLALVLTVSFFAAGLAGKIIVIDPGHGGSDPGAVGKFVKEAELNLKVALYLREMLEKDGAVVIMTRASDIDVDLKTRADLANRTKGDLFVSIHFNSMPNSPESDFSIAYYSSYSADYARNVASYLIETFRKHVGTNGDAGPGQVYVMREVRIPAVLGEPCVISNERREKWLMNDENLKAVALAYWEAIHKLFQSQLPEIYIDEISTIKNRSFSVKVFGDIAKGFAFFDNHQLRVEVQDNTLLVSVPENIKPGTYLLTMYAINQSGIYSKKYTKEINFVPPVDNVEIKVLPSSAPAIVGSYYMIEISPYSRNHPVPFNASLVEIDDGFVVLENNILIVPYMGINSTNVRIKLEDNEITIPINFSGDKKVEVVKVYNKKGEFLGYFENIGDPITLTLPGYEEIVYNSVPSKAVSFKSVILQRNFKDFLRGKRILIVCKQNNENLNKAASVLKEYGCDVETVIVQSKRDEINVSKNSSSFDFVFLKELNIVVKPKIASYEISTDNEVDEIIDFLQKTADTN